MYNPATIHMLQQSTQRGDYELFKQQIAFLKEHFTFVTMEDVMEACNSENGTLPENAVLLTFDDGYIDNFTAVFPILKENKIQGSFLSRERLLRKMCCWTSTKFTLRWQARMCILW